MRTWAETPRPAAPRLLSCRIHAPGAASASAATSRPRPDRAARMAKPTNSACCLAPRRGRTMCVKEPRISHRVEQALTTYRGRGHQTIDSMKTASHPTGRHSGTARKRRARKPAPRNDEFNCRGQLVLAQYSRTGRSARRSVGLRSRGLVLGNHCRPFDLRAGRKIGAPIDRHVSEFAGARIEDRPARRAVPARSAVPRPTPQGDPPLARPGRRPSSRSRSRPPGIARL